MEEGTRVDPDVESKIFRKINYYLNNKNISAVVISGSKAPGFSDNLYPSIVHKCLSKNVPVVADYRGSDLINTLEAVKPLNSKAHLLTIKPNAQELCSTFLCNNTEADIKNCIETIHNTYGCNCVITHGEHPVLAHLQRFSFFLFKVFKYANTTGCGDAFTAGFASIISIEENFHKAVKKDSNAAKKCFNTDRAVFYKKRPYFLDFLVYFYHIYYIDKIKIFGGHYG